jgi:hypothetical protein
MTWRIWFKSASMTGFLHFWKESSVQNGMQQRGLAVSTHICYAIDNELMG